MSTATSTLKHKNSLKRPFLSKTKDLEKQQKYDSCIDLGTIAIDYLMFAQVQRFREGMELYPKWNTLLVKVQAEYRVEQIGAVEPATSNVEALNGDPECSCYEQENEHQALPKIPGTADRNHSQPIATSFQCCSNDTKFYHMKCIRSGFWFVSTITIESRWSLASHQSCMYIIPKDFQFLSEIEFFIGDGKRPERFAIMPTH